jgi:quinol monooxygenase YgiN
MSKIALIAKLTAAEGKRAELVTALEKIFPAVEQEPGTEIYVLNEDAGDENVVWFYELYSDNDAFAAHGSSDAMKEMMGALGGGLLGGAPEMHMVTPVRGKGVTL